MISVATGKHYIKGTVLVSIERVEEEVACFPVSNCPVLQSLLFSSQAILYTTSLSRRAERRIHALCYCTYVPFRIKVPFPTARPKVA